MHNPGTAERVDAVALLVVEDEELPNRTGSEAALVDSVLEAHLNDILTMDRAA